MHFATLVNVYDPGDLDDALEPFGSDPDPGYLKFCDETKRLKDDYKTALITAVKLESGKLVCPSDIASKYYIRDGKVLKFSKKDDKYIETAKTKKMQVIKNCPATSVFKSYRSYATRYAGAEYNKAEKAYGYYYNPDAQWDWYTIGGRFDNCFLVKKDNENASEKTENADKNLRFTPKGYEWVSVAKVSDIEWSLMLKIKKWRASKTFHEFARMYITGIVPEKSFCQIDLESKCLRCVGEVVYKEAMTLSEYLDENVRQISCYSFLTICGEWESKDYHNEWEKFIFDKIADADPESYLAMVDCHM